MKRHSLNRDWTYVDSFQDDYISEYPKGTKVSLPHTNKELPLNNINEQDYQFISSYYRTITIKKEENKRYIIRFEGVMTYAEVYLNTKLIGSHKGGYTPFEFDVTDTILSGDNLLFVKVDSTERKDIPPFGFVIDYLCYGGMYREAYLIEQELTYVDQVFVHQDKDKHHMHFKAFLKATDQTEKTLSFDILDKGVVIHSFSDTISESGTYSYKEHLHLENWSLDNPKLYDLKVYVDDILSLETVIASRTVEMKEDGFYLNNKKVKLMGLNRHQSFPYVGYAMPSNAQKRDADILKFELGVNVVRSSHYPPSKHFLDRCDEIGLLVFNEIPGWQHIGDTAWQEVAIENTKEMIYRDYNHPSIFIWGTRINESPDSDEFYSKTAQMARSLDTSRPIGGVRNFKGSSLIEDVYTYNDFVHRGDNIGLELPKQVAKKQVPYLVTEYNGHMFPTKPFDEESKRVEQAKRHLNVQDASFKEDTISGAIGWCMFDYNTHKDFGSGDRVCYHGVMDMFRNKKYAASVYRSQSQHEPYLEVLGSLNVGEQEASEIKELLVLTNSDFVRFYINDDLIGEIYPSKEWKHLPHPPIVIHDFIGRLIHDNEPFEEKDADTVKEILLHIMRFGMNLPLRLKIKMLFFMRKYKYTIDQAAKLYENYVGKWGQESITYRFEGIKDNSVVTTKVVGATYGSKLEVDVEDLVLEETDTYQTTKVNVTHVNNNGNILSYSNEVIKVDIDGPLTIIGPSTIPFIGGHASFYVKTQHKKGQATLHIDSLYEGNHKVNIQVK
jgi:beta-galactosidase